MSDSDTPGTPSTLAGGSWVPPTAPRAPSPGCPGQGEGRRVRQRRGPQLYDTPSEEWDTAGDSPGGPPTRQSRLPRDDERPADEYDQPWEWKKDHISRAFAGDSVTASPGCHLGCHGCRSWLSAPSGARGEHPRAPQPYIPQLPWVSVLHLGIPSTVGCPMAVTPVTPTSCDPHGCHPCHPNIL